MSFRPPGYRLSLLMMSAAITGLSLSQAQEQIPSNVPTTNVQFPNTPVPVILLEYERLTGKRVIRDANIQDKTISIQTSGKMTYAEAARFIEESLILNGYAILATDDPNEMKIVAYNLDKKLTSEGLPVLTLPSQLPDSDVVVTYIMPLAYLAPTEAAELFESIVDLHPYGRITPLQNASAVVITENTTVIRKLIALRDHLDVSLQRTVDRTFHLQRADAEETVEALSDILGLADQDPNPTSTTPGAQNPTPTQNVSLPGGVGATIPSISQGSTNYARPAAPKPRLRAMPWANKILVVATPVDMEHIENLISHLDAPYENSNYMRRKLKYISVSDFLQIAGDIITRGTDEESGDASVASAQDQNRFGNQQGIQQGFDSGSSSSAAGNLGNAGADEAEPPQSIVIGKTLLIADNLQNQLIASGPPEHLFLINELLDTMDCRPDQIQISAVISQLNLGDDFEFGFDFLRSLDNLGTGNPASVAGVFGSTGNPLLNVGTLADPTNLLGAAQGLTVYGQLNTYTDVVFRTLAQTDRFKVLSRPTVYTVNNRLATIETGQRVAIPRNTLTSTDPGVIVNNQVINSTIDYEDVVLRIDVIPLINENGEITLQIRQKNDNIVGTQVIGGNQVPTIGTQALGTTVMVQDGGMVLLGGLISEQDSRTKSGLPLFFDFQLLGRVFGNTVDDIERQELLIFIQPKIIRSHSEHYQVDDDMIERTRVGQGARDFGEGERDNLEVFESQDFNSPEKRIRFFNNLFKKKDKTEPGINSSPNRQSESYESPSPANNRSGSSNRQGGQESLPDVPEFRAVPVESP
ncbi:MAG: secretin N-terminal domain-containing protein [Verrucomicrobiota bacterium]